MSDRIDLPGNSDLLRFRANDDEQPCQLIATEIAGGKCGSAAGRLLRNRHSFYPVTVSMSHALTGHRAPSRAYMTHGRSWMRGQPEVKREQHSISTNAPFALAHMLKSEAHTAIQYRLHMLAHRLRQSWYLTQVLAPPVFTLQNGLCELASSLVRSVKN